MKKKRTILFFLSLIIIFKLIYLWVREVTIYNVYTRKVSYGESYSSSVFFFCFAMSWIDRISAFCIISCSVICPKPKIYSILNLLNPTHTQQFQFHTIIGVRRLKKWLIKCRNRFFSFTFRRWRTLMARRWGVAFWSLRTCACIFWHFLGLSFITRNKIIRKILYIKPIRSSPMSLFSSTTWADRWCSLNTIEISVWRINTLMRWTSTLLISIW